MWKSHQSAKGLDAKGDVVAQPPRRRKVVIWIERSLLACGLALVVAYGAARIEGVLASRAALKKFAAIDAPAHVTGESNDGAQPLLDPADKAGELSLPDVDFSQWGNRRKTAYQQSAGKTSGVPLAVLRIPKISLEAPLFEGTDDLTLNHAVGRIAGTAHVGEPGNIGIAGHRDGFFRGLKDVGVGDAIELKTLEGIDTYIVDDIKIVAPHQVDVLRPRSVPSLTLVTCYPFYFLGSAPQRYIVTASLSREINGGAEGSDPRSPSDANNSIRRKHMKLFGKNAQLFHGAGSVVLAMMMLGTGWAQDSTVTTTQHGPSSFDTEVKNAEVVYVEGNDLVLRLQGGGVEHLVVPDSDRFAIDGKELSVHELTPGTRLTQTITTITTPRYVNSVRTLEGKVWHVNAPRSVILTLPDNSNQVFNVPNDAKFTVNGETKTVFDLKKGMKLKATIVTDDEHTVVERNQLTFGKAPVPATPREVGVLLFVAPPQPPVTVASAEEPAAVLPETGSSLPLVGLTGAFAIAMAFGLRTVRQARSI